MESDRVYHNRAEESRVRVKAFTERLREIEQKLDRIARNGRWWDLRWKKHRQPYEELKDYYIEIISNWEKISLTYDEFTDTAVALNQAWASLRQSEMDNMPKFVVKESERSNGSGAADPQESLRRAHPDR